MKVIKKIKNDIMDKIIKGADILSSTVIGCNKQKEEKTIIIKEYIKKQRAEIEISKIRQGKIAKINLVNYGTRKWHNYIEELELIDVNKFVRETNDYYVFLDFKDREFRILKQNILCFIYN